MNSQLTTKPPVSCVAFRKNLFDLVNSDTFWLSPTPTQPGSKFKDSKLPRIVSWLHLR